MTFPGKKELAQEYAEELCKVANQRTGYHWALKMILDKLPCNPPNEDQKKQIIEAARNRDFEVIAEIIDTLN